VTGLPLNRESFGPLVGDTIQVPAHDLDAMAAVLRANEGRIAAIIAEPVIGAGGVYPPHQGELTGLRTLADEAGAWLIFDEVICGFGRLGRWFGGSRWDVVPDLVTFAKGVTSGYQPLGGVLLARPVCDVLEADPALVLRHGHTYSGHPAGCAAASANIAVLDDEGLLARADPIGARLQAGLGALLDDGLVAEVRGCGAVWAAGLHGDDAIAVRDAMMLEGVIARPLGTSTIAFCPPLVIGDDQLDRCVDALGTVLRASR
jgi:adenosylmethionine-8-amino-7-oxononanoate aminotransferase